MPTIVVLVKQVPDTYSTRDIVEGSWVIDRGQKDQILDEINERAVEEALQIKERDGGEVVALTMGPARASEAIRKALNMGADRGLHIVDDAIAGSDAIQTAWVLARALGTIEGVEIVIAGNESTDGRVGAVPSIMAEYLGLPQLTQVKKLTIEGSVAKAVRETEVGTYELECSLPVIISVSEKINEPRFPSFKSIVAGKKKPIQELTLQEIGVERDEVGAANASCEVVSATPAPPKQAGERITSEGDGGNQIAEYLIGKKII